MTPTRAPELEQTAAPPDISPQMAEIVVALASQARALRRPTLLCATIACLAAAVLWLSTYGSYVFLSPRSFFLCTAILAALLVPGIFLLWVYRSLVETVKLPGKFHLPSQEIPTDSTTVETDAGGSLLTRFRRRLVRRVDAAWKVWVSLEYFSAIGSVGGPRCFLWFLATPVSQFVVGLALLASVLLVLLAMLQTVRVIVGSAF